jgi:hypothetical protein
MEQLGFNRIYMVTPSIIEAVIMDEAGILETVDKCFSIDRGLIWVELSLAVWVVSDMYQRVSDLN